MCIRDRIKAVIGFLGKRAAHNGSLDDSGIQLVQELICITLVDAEFHPGMLLAEGGNLSYDGFGFHGRNHTQAQGAQKSLPHLFQFLQMCIRDRP